MVSAPFPSRVITPVPIFFTIYEIPLLEAAAGNVNVIVFEARITPASEVANVPVAVFAAKLREVFAEVTALSAISPVAMVPSDIFAELTALFAMVNAPVLESVASPLIDTEAAEFELFPTIIFPEVKVLHRGDTPDTVTFVAEVT